MGNQSKVKETIIANCRKLYDKGYLPGIDGNISMKVDDETIFITPSGVAKDVVTQDDLVLVSLDGQVLGGQKKPSIETPMHIAAYNNQSSVTAVIHSHSPNVAAFAIARKKIDTRFATFAHFHLGEVGYVPYSAVNNGTFLDDVASLMKNGHISILLENHGSVVLGTDMHDAYAKVDLLDNYAGMLIKASSLGGAHALTDKEISDIDAG